MRFNYKELALSRDSAAGLIKKRLLIVEMQTCHEAETDRSLEFQAKWVDYDD